MIHEVIVSTVGAEGAVHLAPMGIHDHPEGWVIAPFRPSLTLDNLLVNPAAVINCTDDVRVFAGCLTGRREWPVCPANRVKGVILADSLAVAEVAVARIEDDPVRPRFICRVVDETCLRPFRGFNRAQAAVIEAAILVSRLRMLPAEQVAQQFQALAVAVAKTAGDAEQEAWGWLVQAVEEFRLQATEAAP